MSSTIQIREDDDRRVTPSPYLPLSEEDMMKKLERSREYSKTGFCEICRRCHFRYEVEVWVIK